MSEPSTEEIINRQLALLRLILHKSMELLPNIDKNLQVELYKQVCADIRAAKKKKPFVDIKQRGLGVSNVKSPWC